MCRQYPESIYHLFMDCAIIQPTILYIENLISTIYPYQLDSPMTLECIYPLGVNKYARCVVRQCVLMMHMAIWTHRNKVIFVKNHVSEHAIKNIFCQKLKNLFYKLPKHVISIMAWWSCGTLSRRTCKLFHSSLHFFTFCIDTHVTLYYPLILQISGHSAGCVPLGLRVAKSSKALPRSQYIVYFYILL